MIGQNEVCEEAGHSPVYYRISTIGAYWTIIFRDAVTSFITCYFCLKVKNLQENSVKPSNLEGQADPNLLIDFELLLMSVIPHRYFISFL